MAEGMANLLLEKDFRGLPYRACSSGIFASSGLPASEMAVRVMAEQGVDISKHRSSQVNSWEPPEDTLFFGMTRDHQMELSRLFPSRGSRVFLLGDAASPGYRGSLTEVPDPYGFSILSYREIASLIREMLLGLLPSLDKDPRFST